MSIIGLDVGTTTLSAVVLDSRTLRPLDRRTVAHGAFLRGESYEKIQDPERILSLALSVTDELASRHAPVEAIGLTGQMHGVLYVNESGEAISPLYTWQDGRGNLPLPDGRRFADALSEETGCPLASGYGSVTHAWLKRRGLLPGSAAKMCTIHAWIAMKLTGRAEPLLHASDAASLGCFDVPSGRFDQKAIASLGAEYFPETVKSACVLGETPYGAKVVTAVGDNQASFIGAMGGETDAVLVNIGTGSQVSVRTGRFLSCPGCETRPLDGDACLLVGAPLCGGRAYAMLEKFIRSCAALAGAEPGPLYEKMNELAMDAPENPLSVNTAFCGTRSDPDARGSIGNLSEDNFTPAHFIHGVLSGMAGELHGCYASMTAATGAPARKLIASGNAVRLNPALRKILENMFGLPLSMPDAAEEAAFGAALLAGRVCGGDSTYRR